MLCTSSSIILSLWEAIGFWALYLSDGIPENFSASANKQGKFLTGNRLQKCCRNTRFLTLPMSSSPRPPSHMPTFFFLHIHVKITDCFFFFYFWVFCSPWFWDIYPKWYTSHKSPGPFVISNLKEKVSRNRKKYSWRQQFQCYGPDEANRVTAIFMLSMRTEFVMFFRILL